MASGPLRVGPEPNTWTCDAQIVDRNMGKLGPSLVYSSEVSGGLFRLLPRPE